MHFSFIAFCRMRDFSRIDMSPFKYALICLMQNCQRRIIKSIYGSEITLLKARSDYPGKTH